MGIATRIPADTFPQIQTNAGCLLYNFNPEKPAINDEDIICPTTGGINAVCEPTFMDLGEDVDNCPGDLLELKKVVRYNCRLEFTSLGTTLKSIALSLGAADINDEAEKVTPRLDLKITDAKDIWWVGDRADGGLVAVCLKRALSTAGLSLQTSKDGKGRTKTTLTGHATVETQDEVPMEFYSLKPKAA